MEKLTFKVNEYEGPLDLILALLSKHQIGIYDINISDLLEQYMAYIRTLRENQMEVASEFLEMASRLVYIKTASLLPRYEKEEDPRAELVGQLLEYQSCKQAAALLRLRDTGWSVFTRAPCRWRSTLPTAAVTPSASWPTLTGRPAAEESAACPRRKPPLPRWSPSLWFRWQACIMHLRGAFTGRAGPACKASGPITTTAASWWPPLWRCWSC